MAGSFLDTNVLLYLASADSRKAARAEDLIRAGGTISVQVLNEIANVARRKMGLDWNETRAFLATIRSLLPVLPLTAELHEEGLELAERYRLSVYDATIVAGALIGNCDILWSQDMQHGLRIAGGLQILDPFR